MKTARQIFFINKAIQGPLAVRVATYWLFCLLAMFVLMAAFPLVISMVVPLKNTPSPGELFARTFAVSWPALVAALMILPAVVWDSIKMSNRFVGPLYRMQHTIDQVLAGEKVDPVKLRKDDLLFEFADKVNALIAYAQEARVEEDGHMAQASVTREPATAMRG